jgi:predicted alpha/beta-fold hydrolase
VELIYRPTLGISALDDPIVSGGRSSSASTEHQRLMTDCLPYTAITASSHFVLAAVPHGGYLGWFNGPLLGPDKHSRWHVRPVIEFLTGALNSLKYEIEPLVVKESGGWKFAEETGWMVVEDIYIHSGKAI